MHLNIQPEQKIYLILNKKEIRISRFQQQLPNEYVSVEQTKPAITQEHLNEIIFVTYFIDDGKLGRIGFEARIKAITAEGRLILYKLNDPAPCELRRWPRIKKNLLPKVRVRCQKKETQVVDISSNGAHLIMYEADHSVKIGTNVNLKFQFDEAEVCVEGKILRRWDDEFHRRHVAVVFDEDNSLSKYIY
ncbi:MAG TPA: PilZ domain-containing protein [Smithellaceae bacterium]|nr:PilZ domain-containing protein [Smithellaceae bacterium]HRS88756.1 PilZ domain-containing protein [Smithellaceae bacterium]HRV26513.1 PilZ domain-containing protein [Smithellaceae bacterium]